MIGSLWRRMRARIAGDPPLVACSAGHRWSSNYRKIGQRCGAHYQRVVARNGEDGLGEIDLELQVCGADIDRRWRR